MTAADLALACSGTVTTELASQGCAMLVAYRMGALTWFLANRFLYQPDYATLLNIAAGEEVAEEFLQDRLTADNLVQSARALIDSEEARSLQVGKQFEALEKMGLGGEPAHQIAAKALLNFI